ncbi:MAG: HDIG domain-containing protein [Nitrospiraceae bacterium]|nr:HDIG domain-containing protein [Nitrospiraceae bacterium]
MNNPLLQEEHPGTGLSFPAALALVDRLGGDALWTRHCRAAARVAERAGELLADRSPVDREFLRVAALVHDIGRHKTQDPVLHGVEGFRFLSSLGHHREAFVCVCHIQCGLSRREALQFGLPDRDFLPRTLEERMIPVIDSVVELDRPTTIDARFASLARRYPHNPLFLATVDRSHRRVRALFDHIESRYGISLEKVAAEALG